MGSSRNSSNFGYSIRSSAKCDIGRGVRRSYLGSKLDGDGSAFPVLDTKRANDCICVCFQTTHLQTLVNTIHGRTAILESGWRGRRRRHTRLPSQLVGQMRAAEVSPRTRVPRGRLILEREYPSAEHTPSGSESPQAAHVHLPSNHRGRYRLRRAERAH